MRHVETELLVAVLEGQLPPRTLLRVILGHLEDLCPECRETLEMFHGLVTGDAAADASGGTAGVGEAACGLHEHLSAVESADRRVVPRYRAAFAGAEAALHAWARRAREERRVARRDLAALRRLPAEARAGRVHRARSRFRSRALAELLLDECRRLTRDEPEEARQLAELVPVVLARRWPGGQHACDHDAAEVLALRSAAWRANALRVLGRLQEANVAFAQVRAGLARDIVDDAVLHADVCTLEASLRIDQGRLREARHLLDRAVLLFRQQGEDRELARVLIKRGIVERRQGEPEAAAATQREVLDLLAGQDEPELVRLAVGNLALALCDAGHFAEAAALVDEHPGFRGEATPRWRVKESVVRGRVALGLGRVGEAESLFRDAHGSAVEQGDSFAAALTALELVALFLEQGRTRELREMTAVLAPVFEAHDLRQEATAALLLFTRAALSEGLTAEAVRRLRWKIEVGGRAGVPPPAS